MTEDELKKLSAYADGELDPADRDAIENAMAQNPAMRDTLDVYGRLSGSARLEAVPQVLPAADNIWQKLARELESPPEQIKRILDFAATESAPDLAPDRFEKIGKYIALHSVAKKELMPSVSHQRWKGVWSGISSRNIPALTASRIAKSAPPAPIKNPSPHANWFLTIGFGLAASVLFSFAIPGPAPLPPEDLSDATASAPMAIPDALDDHYGVRVRMVPGSTDPVVTLYFKNSSTDDNIDNFDFE
ncbi:MAG TPA: zf-HC2 domain-containing protein [Planctomycetota bacterium]|nr:zf-HC2 domain-containing protein [Planctomycetota bacterium]